MHAARILAVLLGGLGFVEEAFARQGDPNGSNAPYWPAYTRYSDATLALDLPEPIAETGYLKPECDLWDSLLDAL